MERKFCQSCGMPLDDPAFFGTEADGSESRIIANTVTKAALLPRI